VGLRYRKLNGRNRYCNRSLSKLLRGDRDYVERRIGPALDAVVRVPVGDDELRRRLGMAVRTTRALAILTNACISPATLCDGRFIYSSVERTVAASVVAALRQRLNHMRQPEGNLPKGQ